MTSEPDYINPPETPQPCLFHGAEHHFTCFHRGDPVNLLRPIAHPQRTPRLGPKISDIEQDWADLYPLFLHATFAGMDISVNISPPKCWQFSAEHSPLASALASEPDLWMVTIQTDWRVPPQRASEGHDNGEAPVDILAALLESDACVIMAKPSRIELFRAGWALHHLPFAPTRSILVAAHRTEPTSSRDATWERMALKLRDDARFEGQISEVENLEFIKDVSEPDQLPLDEIDFPDMVQLKRRLIVAWQ